MNTRIEKRVTRLEAGQLAAAVDHERETLEALTDGELCRHMARLQFVYEFAVMSLAPDYGLVPQVDALVAAGDLAGAWANVTTRHNQSQD